MKCIAKFPVYNLSHTDKENGDTMYQEEQYSSAYIEASLL
jgi:hypothetical protein